MNGLGWLSLKFSSSGINIFFSNLREAELNFRADNPQKTIK
jgi:hypothetical protein